MTDDELLLRLSEMPVDEWTLDEIEELRARLPHSAPLREAMQEHLLVETVLTQSLAKPKISAEQILARIDAERRSRSGGRAKWWAALLVLVPAVSAGVWCYQMWQEPEVPLAAVDPDKPPLWSTAAATPTGPRPPAATKPVPVPTATASATSELKVEPPSPPPPKADEPEPWVSMLARAPRPLEELALDDRRLTQDETVLLRWWDTLRGQQRRLEGKDQRGIFIDGTFRLRAPWPADATLSLWLRESPSHDGREERFRLNLWHGDKGVTIDFRRQPFNRFSAFLSTRKPNEPLAETYVFASADDERASRTGHGPIELSFREGRLYVSRGSTLLLTVPMPEMPDAVFFDGKFKLKGMGLARSTGVPDAWVPKAVPTWSDYTPETPLLSSLPEGAKLDRDGPSGLTLSYHSADRETKEAWVALPITRPGFHEAIIKIESADANTGIFWGDEQGKYKYSFGFFSELRNNLLMLQYVDKHDANVRFRYDSRGESEPRVGFPLYLRLVSGMGSIRCYASTDGLSWGRIFDPFRNGNGIVQTIGLYCLPGRETRSISVKNISFRTILTYDDKIAGELPPPPREWTYAPWLLTAMQGNETDEVRYHRLVKALTLGLPLELDRRVMYELATIPCGDLPPGVPKTVAADLDYIGRLASLIDAWDPPIAGLWTKRLALSPELVVDRNDTVARDPRIHAPYSSVRKALIENTPPVAGRVAMMLPDPIRREAMRMVMDGDWDALDQACRVWHHHGGYDELRELGISYSSNIHARAPIMELVDWAAATADRRRDVDTSGTRNPFLREWRHPLIEHFGKEGYNVLAELETALEEKAYGDACRIISSVTAAQAIGLLPNAHDPDLLTALPGSVALAMKSNPELRTAMQREYGDLALLRLRQATADGDVAAVRAITTQFFGTSAAAEAQMWLGDRALTQGDAARAEGHYHAALREGAVPETTAIEARLRLAAAWQGREHGAPPAGSVRFGESVLSPTEFERVVSTLRGRAGAPSASSRVFAPETGPVSAKSWPAPTAYRVQKWADLDGDVGRGNEPPQKNVDYLADQTAVAFTADRMLVSNRFQVAAFELKDGKRAWRTGLGGDQGKTFDWAGTPMAPIVADDRIYVRRLTAQGPELACLALNDGRLLWRSNRGEVVGSDPLLVGDRLLAVTLTVPQSEVLELSLTMYDARTGRTLRSRAIGQVRDYWKRELRCFLVAAEEMFIVSAAACLIGCDAEGEPRWTRRMTYVPTSVDAFLGPAKYEPPTVADDRVEVAQPGVPFRYVVDVRSGAIVEQRPELREQDPLPSPDRDVATTVLEVADGRTLELVRHRFTDKLQRGQVRWRRGKAELTHAWVASWSTSMRGIGPAVAHDGRLWVFAADDLRSGNRRIMELQPQGPPKTGDAALLPSSPARPWLTSTMSSVMEETQILNPHWTLFSPRQTYLDDRTFVLNRLFLNDDCVLTYPGKESSVFWVRQAALPADRPVALYLRTAVADGGSWKLTVQVNQETIFEKQYEPGKSDAPWSDERIDLTKFQGQTVRLTLGCDVDGKKTTYVAWQRMEVQ